jgi:hypothetical protein
MVAAHPSTSLAKTADFTALTPASAVNIEAQGNVYYGTNNPYGGLVSIQGKRWFIWK